MFLYLFHNLLYLCLILNRRVVQFQLYINTLLGDFPISGILGIAIANELYLESYHVLSILLPILSLMNISAVSRIVSQRQIRWDKMLQMVGPSCFGLFLGYMIIRTKYENIAKLFIAFFLLVMCTFQHIYFKYYYPQSNDVLPSSIYSDTKKISNYTTQYIIFLYGIICGFFSILTNSISPIAIIYFIKCDLLISDTSTEVELLHQDVAFSCLLINCLKIPIQLYIGYLSLIQFTILFILSIILVTLTVVLYRPVSVCHLL
jgi:uncharacterized membrane protein YfcA